MKGPTHERDASNFNMDRTLWETARTMDQRIPFDSNKYPKRLKIFKEIYIGHTPTTNYGVDTPIQAVNVFDVDTGAAFNGKLSIVDVDTKEYWQSDQVTTLYPNEKGRNKK
jgi:serine/threonine protein phosphatase 1